ncbi:acyl-CoA/acyl-ACP dehydrogenase [Mycobacterium sp. CVI_P3]|uniref:Acyl-CoA/acyl-ACP dehydrogenase n=1 Tax=Mycobacterium pinniadriaticum TaxID=2994102 RepID=A0ABT3SKW6_9MYCO|nr:acyl-CoA dehydrogenase family protein [Mycobacterium pinniadriaticum]MCX2933050.1 acyl-CoA/acyl-ACP dehydrogenase [Mycobacterium pinniadriaticum]MCX2939472.1 acyl-CoA/acyl-ACP dehydrogenase [Mycobacterium pinniadriaticum]
MTTNLVERARTIADTVLFPAALAVDRTGHVPDSHWETLAEAGLYGIAAPAEAGGPGLTLPQIIQILEAMAGGCLATAFTWVQHHGMLAALAASGNHALRDEVLPGAITGQIRGGVAYAGAVPVPPRMRAQRVSDGWRLSGHAPFVSGWGIIDVIQISAADVKTGDIVAGLVSAEMQPGITAVSAQPLFVADASQTVALEVDGLVIPDDRIVSQLPRDVFMANQNFGSRLNATLPIGLVGRCARLLDGAGEGAAAAALRGEADAVRERLDAGLGDASTLLRARADGCELASRAASALVAARGGPSLLRADPAQLLARSAVFTLVAASRPELKRSLIDQMSRPPSRID